MDAEIRGGDIYELLDHNATVRDLCRMQLEYGWPRTGELNSFQMNSVFLGDDVMVVWLQFELCPPDRITQAWS
jgi:hypothetical protein